MAKHNPALHARAVERATEAANDYLRAATDEQGDAREYHMEAQRRIEKWAESAADHWTHHREMGKGPEWLVDRAAYRRARAEKHRDEAIRSQEASAKQHLESRKSIDLYLREERWLNANA
ncbi:unnamed protein product [marine sediment metagenome]|uniref:Uncharacterized protein n=1 Tax=marine sediment metagenome TaxID=412755 RepID=X0T4I8_9ZZZZ